MPKYTFLCSECGSSTQRYVSRKTRELDCACGAKMLRQVPRLSGPPEVKETVDKFFNVQLPQDHKEQIRERSDEYYWSVEVPRLVNSGKYSLETMLEMGWVYFDEKNQLQVQTKPPSKR